MAVRLHRCPNVWVKLSGHPCWKVQKALDEQGISYEIVKEWGFPRDRRKGLIELSGQKMLPVIEFEDGTHYREESDDMAARVRAGELFR